MPSQESQPPAGVVEAVRLAAAELLPSRLNTIRQGIALDSISHVSAVTDVASPRQLFTLGLDRILDGSGLKSAVAAGWRTLVTVANQPVAMADTGSGADATTVRSMNYGPFVAGLAALGTSAAAEPGDSANLEERVLQVPALFLVGLWLHSDVEDTVIPAEPAPSGLVAGQRYSGDELIAQLTPLAQIRVDIDDHGLR